MNKMIVAVLALVSLVAFSSQEAFADGYIMCNAPALPGQMSKRAGCIAVYNPGEKACSDKAGKTCSTESLADLCVITGKKIDLPYFEYASGQGSFATMQACKDKCEQQYGGKFKKFGGECFSKVAE